MGFFFFNDTATTEIYTLSLHDALPISPIGNAMPGTICSPLEKLWAQRIPGLIDRPWLAAVPPGPRPASSRVHTISSRALKAGRPHHKKLAPRLHHTPLALSTTTLLVQGGTEPPAFQRLT